MQVSSAARIMHGDGMRSRVSSERTAKVPAVSSPFDAVTCRSTSPPGTHVRDFTAFSFLFLSKANGFTHFIANQEQIEPAQKSGLYIVQQSNLPKLTGILLWAGR